MEWAACVEDVTVPLDLIYHITHTEHAVPVLQAEAPLLANHVVSLFRDISQDGFKSWILFKSIKFITSDTYFSYQVSALRDKSRNKEQ